MSSKEIQELNDVMAREVHVMREVLASMHMEQRAILQRDCAKLLLIKENRTNLISAMRRLRGLILDKIDHLEHPGECEFTSLKDQIMTLVEKIQSAHKNNRSLSAVPQYAVPLLKPKLPKITVMTITESPSASELNP